MIESSPVRHHMTRRHDLVRLCDGQPAGDDDIPATDIDVLRDARAEATLCPVCQQNSHIHDYSLRPDRYQDGRRTLAHLYTVPVPPPKRAVGITFAITVPLPSRFGPEYDPRNRPASTPILL